MNKKNTNKKTDIDKRTYVWDYSLSQHKSANDHLPLWEGAGYDDCTCRNISLGCPPSCLPSCTLWGDPLSSAFQTVSLQFHLMTEKMEY